MAEDLRRENEELRRQLEDARQALEAMATGQVDAVASLGSRGPILVQAAQEKLRESQRLLRAIFEGTLDAVVLADDSARYVDANPAACELFGLPREELLRRRVADFAESPAETEKTWRAFLAAGRGTSQFRLRRADGTIREVDYSATANILPGLHLSVLRDVTERRRAERELEDFFALSPDLLCIAGMDGRFKRLNPAWERTLGWSLEELISRPWLDFVHPDDREATARAISVPAGGGGPARFENRCRCKDGTYRWLAWAAKPSHEDRVIYATAHDVTERRASAERDRLLFAESPIPKLLIDADQHIVDVNHAAVATYGYTRDEFLRMSVLDVVVREELPAARAKWDEVLAVGAVLASRRHRTKTGGVLQVDATVKRIMVGERPIVLASIRDVTEQRRLEEQLVHAQKMEAVGRLAGGVAHDFNNLLSVVLSYTALILQDLKEGDSLRADIDEIHKAGKRAADLTRQLLAFSRKQILQPQVIDLNHVVAGMEKMLERLLHADVELAILPTHPLGKVLADPGQIEQVVMNLAVNARDAMPRGGKLSIETANVELDAAYADEHPGVVAGAYVMLAVTDTGVGMDAAVRARIFEPFFTTKEQGKGTGLGLSTVFGIVNQSGGHIWVYSEPGHGTTFKIYLPRTDQVASVVTSAPPAADTLRGAETVLLVEDEEAVRVLMRTILQRSGYNVLDAANAGEALLACEQFPSRIHLLLTDVVMPRMSGKQLAERLHALRPELKVLYMSGYTDHAIVHHGVLEAGVAFLQKPITPDTLLRKVRAILDS